MIKHVVCQKFADRADAAQAAEMLRALVGQVPTLQSLSLIHILQQNGIDAIAVDAYGNLITRIFHL